MEFNKRLIQLRKKKNLYQVDVAKVIGVARATYGAYEQGNRQPDFETLSRIAEYYDVSTDYLLGKSDNPNTTNDDLIDEEIKYLTDKMQVWYKNEPKDKKVKLDMLRRMLKSFEDDE